MIDRVLTFVQQNRGFLALLGLLVVAFLVLHNRATKLASVDELEALVGNGQPIVIEFYANT